MDASCRARDCSALVELLRQVSGVDLFGAPDALVLSPFRMARALGMRAALSFHEEICIISRDKTELTMGKPEVNSTFHKN